MCDLSAAESRWDLVAVAVLEWAMQDHVLAAEQKAEALTFVQAGLFGRGSSYIERRLSGYRPPIGPGGELPLRPW